MLKGGREGMREQVARHGGHDHLGRSTIEGILELVDLVVLGQALALEERVDDDY